MVWAALGACGGPFGRLFGSLWGCFGELWASFGTLGLFGALFGDLWVTFGVALGYLWTALGCLWAPFWILWVAFGARGEAFGHLLGFISDLFVIKNTIKGTLGNHWVFLRKTICFVGLGGQVDAKMAPK